MGGRLDKSEVAFKIISYTLLTIFALFCLYPFVYTISAAISSTDAVDAGKVVIFPIGVQFKAFKYVFENKSFWLSYTSTLFVTLWGTIWSMVISIFGGYALSKRRIPFNKGLNFFLVFTMWFSAGMIPTLINYQQTRKIFANIGIVDQKWVVVIAMGIAAYNIILLRNAFQGVPKEIEEAATVDGANEFQIATKVYIPMSKASIATVALFYGVSRWNGYFWAKQVMIGEDQVPPLQVYIRNTLDEIENADTKPEFDGFSVNSLFYAMIVCAVVPVIIIYPFIQKYFAAGVNLGGVKE